MTSTNLSAQRENPSLDQIKSTIEKKASDTLGMDKEKIDEKIVRPVKEKAEQARQLFQEQSGKAAEYSRQHPLLIGAAMFTAGVALGSFISGNGRHGGSNKLSSR